MIIWKGSYINIPEQKSTMVKQILQGLGVTIEQSEPDTYSYKEKLTQVSTWSDEELKLIEESKSAFESLKPQQW